MTSEKKLRLISYLSPHSMPIEYFQCIQEYLEEKLAMESYLIYESRWEGPPMNRLDPFTLDEADIGFISSTSFLRLFDSGNKYLELIPVAPIHEHPMTQGRPVYFTDVIIHASNSSRIDDFDSLKGHKWAYSNDESVSAHDTTLEFLKKLGTNATYFGNVLKSGSHLKSIRMVLDGSADAAPISSTYLCHYRKTRPEIKDKIKTLTSWGPLPNHPMVFNSRLPSEYKEKICELLMNMPTDQKWRDKLALFSVQGFVASDLSLYQREVNLRTKTKNLGMTAVYY
ncbi:uncharacterized protein LOC141899456 [Tubulanus polymorphus]|uniref:uncharacterized protein LOC141899456 n=1 Tax=Tubulanus polymorphus TaxID=672921 RepID=UPI003DA2B434